MSYTEFSFIENIKRKTKHLVPSNCEGIGDDCAIIYHNSDDATVITADMLIENSHFLLWATTAFELGRKCATENLSDVVSMGATPTYMLLSLGLTEQYINNKEWLDDFIKGVLSYGVPIIGGDTTKSTKGLVVNITAMGSIARSNIKRRSMAKVGDSIFVSAELGDSAAGLHSHLNKASNKALEYAHNNPTAHIKEGAILGSHLEVHAMMDISDGLASDIKRIITASHVSATIDVTAIPMTETLIQYCAEQNLDPLVFSIAGGDDYKLLYTASKDYIPSIKSFKIGEIVEGDGKIYYSDDKQHEGFSHF